MKQLLCFLLLCLAGGLNAAVISKTFQIGPGENGLHVITEVAMPGDTLVVKFIPKKCYEIKSCQADDAAGLGWQPAGDCTFKLLVTEKIEPLIKHTTKFFGELAYICTDGKGGEGTTDLTWDLRGRFTVLGECEGVGHDNGRNPEAGLKTEKNNSPPSREGLATYQDANGKKSFIGSFEGKYTGVYTGQVTAHSTAMKPMQLGDVEEKDCPDKSSVKVKYVYFGCDNSAGIGGRIVPDTIKINNFQKDLDVSKQRALLAKAQAALEKAKADKQAAEIARDAAKVAKDRADADYEKALAEQPGVAAAQAAVASAEARLAATQVELNLSIAEEQNRAQQLADYEAKRDIYIKTIGEKNYLQTLVGFQNNLAKAKKVVEEKRERVSQDQAAVDRAKERLQRVIDRATQAVAAQKAAADAAAAHLVKAEDDLLVAVAAILDAEKEVAAAQKALDEAIGENAEIIAFWQEWYDGTLVHELGHRRIAYFFADKITDYMNTFRAWGYAMKEARARQIGKQHFEEVLIAFIIATQAEHDEFQTVYDSPGGSDHGAKQDQWNWDRLR